MARRIKLTIAYLGTPYRGWQRQPGGGTIQDEIEHAVTAVTRGQRIAVVGAGRTDAGVHARGQVAHLDLPETFPPEALLRALNARLPETIRIVHAAVVPPQFHARFSARAKRYTYRIGWGPPPLPWRGLRTARMPEPADRDALLRCLASLAGTHDMASFSVPDPARGPAVRTIYAVRADWGPRTLRLDFLGSGFLRYQVRRMAGALLQVGTGALSVAEFLRLIEEPTPGAPVPTAPAKGLTLEHVFYSVPPRHGGGTAGGPW